MMTPRWQKLRVTPLLRVRSLRPEAEIVRHQWAFSKSGAQVDTRLVHLSLAVTSFVGCDVVVSSIRCGAVASACTASDFVQGTSPATAWSDHVGSRTCTFVLPSVLPHTLGGDWENTFKQFNAQSKWCAFFFWLRDAALSPSSRR